MRQLLFSWCDNDSPKTDEFPQPTAHRMTCDDIRSHALAILEKGIIAIHRPNAPTEAHLRVLLAEAHTEDEMWAVTRRFVDLLASWTGVLAAPPEPMASVPPLHTSNTAQSPDHAIAS